jgi:hypothetical protein
MITAPLFVAGVVAVVLVVKYYGHSIKKWLIGNIQ